MSRTLGIFLLRWSANSFGIWLAVQTFAAGYIQASQDMGMFIIAGLAFSLVNSFIKPIIVFLSLPLLLLSLGLFMFVINGLIVYITLSLVPSIGMSFWHAILTGVVLSLVNYILSGLLEVQYSKNHKGAS